VENFNLHRAQNLKHRLPTVTQNPLFDLMQEMTASGRNVQNLAFFAPKSLILQQTP